MDGDDESVLCEIDEDVVWLSVVVELAFVCRLLLSWRLVVGYC